MAKHPKQIIVLGGGGFLTDPRNACLDRYILNLTVKPAPKICFVGTASGDSDIFLRRFYRAFENYRCQPTHLPLFKRTQTDPADILLNQDVIYVGGGNTANMLAIWRVHGVDRAMRRAYEKGIILCGVSAGMICWFQSSVTDSFGPLRQLNDGLGLLKGSACPHYDGESMRRPTFHRLIRTKKLPPGVAADDGAAIHFINGQIHRCVSSKPKASAYLVGLSENQVVEIPLPAVPLSLHGVGGR
jgi:dipeptidase E